MKQNLEKQTVTTTLTEPYRTEEEPQRTVVETQESSRTQSKTEP